MGGQGRKTIITYNSPKRYRRCQGKSDCKLSAQCLTFGGESHIIKVIKVEANESIGSPKRKDPLPELQSPKGGFLRLPACQSLSLWERWHCEAMTERASPARKSRRRSDRQALCQSDTIAVPVILGQQPCPLSRACARQLPQRESLCLRGLREFVENARLKRKEFVNVIKMRRRY